MGQADQIPEFVRRFPEAALPFQGVSGWLVQGAESQVAFVEFDEEVDVPEHSHAEQWEIVLAGRAFLRMGGEEQEFRAGDHFFIPAGVPHSAKVEAGYQAVIIFNEPGRYGVRQGAG
jgi:quercetin dioxygenase-like cupin family protein